MLCFQVIFLPLNLQIDVDSYFFSLSPVSSFPFSQSLHTLVLLWHNHFPSLFQLLLNWRPVSGNQHRSLGCESRLEITLKYTHTPLFRHFPFGQLSAWLLGFCRLAALDKMPRSSRHAWRKLHRCCLKICAWVEIHLMGLLFSLWCCWSYTWPKCAHPHLQAFTFEHSCFGSY